MIWTGSNSNSRQVHLFYSLVAVLLAVTAVIVLMVITTNSTDRFLKDWHYITNAYIDSQAALTGEYGAIDQVVRAIKPDNLTEKLALTTFGEGTHFAVHGQPGMGYGEIITQVLTVSAESLGKKQLVYPPQKLWCVYLKYEEKQDVVIFLGYHRDMYSAEWVAHVGEQTPFSIAFTKLLTQLDCEFSSITE